MQSLIGTSESSQILKVHPATVTRMAEDGRLTPVGRLGDGGALIFDRADVERLARDRKAEAEAVTS